MEGEPPGSGLHGLHLRSWRRSDGDSARAGGLELELQERDPGKRSKLGPISLHMLLNVFN